MLCVCVCLCGCACVSVWICVCVYIYIYIFFFLEILRFIRNLTYADHTWSYSSTHPFSLIVLYCLLFWNLTIPSLVGFNICLTPPSAKRSPRNDNKLHLKLMFQYQMRSVQDLLIAIRPWSTPTRIGSTYKGPIDKAPLHVHFTDDVLNIALNTSSVSMAHGSGELALHFHCLRYSLISIPRTCLGSIYGFDRSVLDNG